MDGALTELEIAGKVRDVARGLLIGNGVATTSNIVTQIQTQTVSRIPGLMAHQVDCALRDYPGEFRQIAGAWPGWRWCLTKSSAGRAASLDCVKAYAPGMIAGALSYTSAGVVPSLHGSGSQDIEQVSEGTMTARMQLLTLKVRGFLADHPDSTTSEIMKGIGASAHLFAETLRCMRPELVKGRRSFLDKRKSLRSVMTLSLIEAKAS